MADEAVAQAPQSTPSNDPPAQAAPQQSAQAPPDGASPAQSAPQSTGDASVAPDPGSGQQPSDSGADARPDPPRPVDPRLKWYQELYDQQAQPRAPQAQQSDPYAERFDRLEQKLGQGSQAPQSLDPRQRIAQAAGSADPDKFAETLHSVMDELVEQRASKLVESTLSSKLGPEWQQNFLGQIETLIDTRQRIDREFSTDESLMPFRSYIEADAQREFNGLRESGKIGSDKESQVMAYQVALQRAKDSWKERLSQFRGQPPTPQGRKEVLSAQGPAAGAAPVPQQGPGEAPASEDPIESTKSWMEMRRRPLRDRMQALNTRWS